MRQTEIEETLEPIAETPKFVKKESKEHDGATASFWLTAAPSIGSQHLIAGQLLVPAACYTNALLLLLLFF